MTKTEKETQKMDNTALYKLTYGVFMLATQADGVKNGCITNTCIQVANDPVRIAVSVINTNYTCELLKKSGVFTLSLLDNTCSYQTIAHFGMQSGRNTDKMAPLPLPVDGNGVPYMGWASCAVISAKVVSSEDLGTHTLFVAEVTDAKVLGDNPPLTYADYHAKLKPKPEKPAEDKKIVAWKCKICGYIYEGETLPADFVCPLCGHPADDFEPVYEN